MADRMDAKLLISSPSSKASSSGTANFRTEEIRGYLFKKTREGKWQKRWFETNGCFLTYYKVVNFGMTWQLCHTDTNVLAKKQGQKLLAALNLPQVGVITLLQEDDADGPGLFTIELNERVYTIKARSNDEAAFWVDALLWRQAGGLVTQQSSDVSKQRLGTTSDQFQAEKTSSPISPMTSKHLEDFRALTPDDVGKDGAPCAACCVVQ